MSRHLEDVPKGSVEMLGRAIVLAGEKQMTKQLDPIIKEANKLKFREWCSINRTGKNNPFFGKKHSEETKKINSEKHIGMCLGEKNPKWKPKIKKECVICKKIYEVKPSIAEKTICCSTKCLAIWRSTNQKIVWEDPLYKQNFIEKITGQKRSDESKKKMGEIQRAIKGNPEYRARCSETQKIIKGTPENREKQKEISKRLWEDPTYRNLHIEFMNGPNNPHLGKPRSKDARKKTSDTLKVTNQNPDVKERRSNHTKELWKDPAYRDKMVAVNIGRVPSDKTKLLQIENFRGGLWYGNINYDEPKYCELWTPEFRERVRMFFSYQCVECGTPQNGKKLHVHHVHYDKKTCCKSGEDIGMRRFVPLCKPCHMKSNMNRPYWEQHFTDIINTYYEGKCYFTKDEMKSFQQGVTV